MNGPKPGNQSEVKNTYGFESIDSDYDETGDDDPEEETDDDASDDNDCQDLQHYRTGQCAQYYCVILSVNGL